MLGGMCPLSIRGDAARRWRPRRGGVDRLVDATTAPLLAAALASLVLSFAGCSKNEASLWLQLSDDARIEAGNKGRLLVDVKNTTHPEPGVVELQVRVDMERPTVPIVYAKDRSRVLWPSYTQVRYREAINCQERVAVVREIRMSDAEGRLVANPPDMEEMIANLKFTPIVPGSNEELLWRSGCSSGGQR